MPVEEFDRLLGMVDVLETLPPGELRSLAARASLERVGAKETVWIGPQDHAQRVIVLLSGRTQVYEPGPRGRRLTVSVAEAGTVVGVSGLSERARGLRVGALAPSVLCLLERGAFEGALRRNPGAALALVGVLAERIGVLEERLGEMAHKGVAARLAGTLLRLIEGEGVVGPGGESIPTRYTHQQLASMIGANREATTRALGALRERGTVEVKERRVHVADSAELRRAALEG